MCAHLGMVLGLARVVGMESGARAGDRKGAGDGAEDLQIDVVGVDFISVSISVRASEGSLPGGGVVRSRIVTFFLVFFGHVTFRGEGLPAFGVLMARLREWDSSSSLASWSVVLDLFLSCWHSSITLASSSASNLAMLAFASSWSAFCFVARYVSASVVRWAFSSTVLV